HRRLDESAAERTQRVRFQTAVPTYRVLFKMPVERSGWPWIVEANHPAFRRCSRFQLEPGDGTPCAFSLAAIARAATPSAYQVNIWRTTFACSASISSWPVPDTEPGT